MTETTSGTTQGSSRGRGPRGLTIERVYTKPGVHPYDEVTWERRDVVMTNWRDGSINFEQRGVEFPDFWSVNAANIVTTKYFRGAVGTEAREWSLKQLIDRVVLTYVKAGQVNGYFGTVDDATIFEHELTYALLHQIFSFNSPVWFNVGTSAPQQVSACQPYDALVSTPAGLVPIGKLVEDDAVGMKVYDAHGLTRIVATKANGVKEVLRLRTKAGDTLDVTADHLVWKASDEVGGRFVEAGSLAVGDLLLFVEPEVGGRNRSTVEVARIEDLGTMDVYDIQTESGEYLSGNLRVHNCFILAVDDKMDSILDWYKEEGLIFKGGSGSGINLSRIRSSKELLSSGGEASGPVSFMRGADASAGTIKSGGATRRAAKMVILDVDHPDIEEFIDTKAREEDKIRVLRDAGYDMDLGGRDMSSVQYQNANNSVRVNEEFMRAYENGTSFGLKARTTGEVIETVDAKALMRKMAEAAWECADPGIQYDDTINDWHTCPETGRITASNPCSEYLHLDNSSCNLASLNLMKFLKDDDTFDAVTFAKVVEFVITAMDISICFADFPTPSIRDTTRAYRQLGIGYANLGALLMATGHAYDSEGGRALAAAITSLMTGTAYRRSAELAGIVGPYEGYARNAEAHTRVMRKHAAASDAIRSVGTIDRDVARLASKAWQDGLKIGENNGWRNSQASVLAPTGCLVGDTMVTTDRGLTKLSGLGDIYGDKWQDVDFQVATDEGPQGATKFFVNGEEPTRRVVTAGGYQIQGTLAHRVKAVDETTGAWVWKRLADIVEGDLVPIQLGGMVGRPRRVPLPVLDEAYYTNDPRLHVPDSIDADLAELVGYFMGDGSLGATGIRFCVAAGDDDVVERLRVLVKGSFGVAIATGERQGYTEVRIDSVRLSRWWQAAGLAKTKPHAQHTGKGWRPRVPAAILETNDPTIYAAFLRGLYEADGTLSKGVPSLNSAAKTFVDEVRSVLLALGVASTTVQSTSGRGGDIWWLRVRNVDHALRFRELIGFMSERKNKLLRVDASPQTGRSDKVYLPEQRWGELAPYGHREWNAVRQAVARWNAVPRVVAERLYSETQDAELGSALGYVFERVAVNDDGGIQPTYDLSVPSNVTYVAGGFVSHNTIGLMMDCDTTGVEPDLALVKFKKLVGGGSMQIVNNTVPRALRKLGYQEEQVEAIVEYIAENGHVVEAPGLRPEHYEVFDCAMGDRSIVAMGHVRMMAAVQPFISGAISKCVTGETLLATADGLIRIDSLHQGERPDSFRDEIIEVASLEGPQKTDAFYYGGEREVREVELRSGHKVVGTPNHRVLVATGDGLDWRYLGEVAEGEYVAVQYGTDMWSSVPACFDDFRPSPSHGNQKKIRIPSEMTEDLALLLGAFASEGHIARSTHTVVVTNSVESVLERVARAWESEFGLTARITREPGKCPGVVVSSKTLVEFLDYLGSGGRASEKRIPDAVLRSPRSMVLSFLQGLAFDAYTHVGEYTKWAICLDAPKLLDDLQAVMTNLGVVHSRITKHNYDNGKDYDEVFACGEEARAMVLLVPFLELDKAERASRMVVTNFAQSTADVVPGITGRELYNAIPLGKSGRNGHRGYRSEFTYLLDPRTKMVSRRTVEKVAALPGVEVPQWLRDVIWDGLHFSPVVKVADAGVREVYDVSVPATHAFVGNGIVNHNTVNLPESATVEDVEQVYYQGWKLGLKALAIYRNNCKVGQPLSDAKEKKASTSATATAPIEYRPTRKRLPKKRPSQTVSFSVAGAEGYMTAGSYPDDGLGEVFLKLGKQGSTLAGVMDAFSIAISIALQYGVPLEAFVSKFVNMRFEPAGMTDDPDVRMAQSIMDYIFRRLALDYLPYEKREELGIFTAEERARSLDATYGGGAPSVSDDEELDVEALAQSAPIEKHASVSEAEAGDAASAISAKRADDDVHSSTELLEKQLGTAADAPLCLNCGTKMRPAGSCYVCEGCGSTSGCS